MKTAIQIITEQSNALGHKYVISALALHWQSWGHKLIHGPARSLDTDLGILHINKTCLKESEVPAVAPGRLLLNRHVLDISKSTLSQLRLHQGDDWDGPVMVKSNLNSFGNPELRLRRRGVIEKARRRLARSFWRLARTLPSNDYPLLPHLSMVPSWVWEREDLLVERFMPERQGDLYSIRGWLFFGERGYAYRLFSASPMVKTGNITHFEILSKVPPELHEFRRSRHFDFGKFDYIEVEGRPVVIDINKTPTTIAKPDSPRLRDLAEGIYDFIGNHK